MDFTLIQLISGFSSHSARFLSSRTKQFSKIRCKINVLFQFHGNQRHRIRRRRRRKGFRELELRPESDLLAGEPTFAITITASFRIAFFSERLWRAQEGEGIEEKGVVREKDDCWIGAVGGVLLPDELVDAFSDPGTGSGTWGYEDQVLESERYHRVYPGRT